MTSHTEMTFTCRHIHHSEVNAAFDIIDQEGWNLTRDKFSLLCKKHPRNFYVAVTDDGEVVATLSYSQTFTDEHILGNLVVKPEFRGRGLGRQIIHDTLALLPHKLVHLTAVPGVDQFYMKNGFKPGGPGHLIRYMTVNNEVIETRAQTVSQEVTIQHMTDSVHDIEALVNYDMKLRNYDNSNFLSAVTHCACVMVATDKGQNSIVGYVIAFTKRDKIVFDGLFADSQDIALLLFRSVLQQFPERSKVKLQLFASNQFLLEFGEVTSSEEYTRYCLGGVPTSVSETSVYCVSDSDYTL